MYIQLKFSLQPDHSELLYSQKWVSILTRTDFRHGWTMFGPLVAKNHSEEGS